MEPMTTMIEVIFDKILLGVSLAAPIGPVNAEMIKRGLTNGFWGSFSVRLGGAVANSICLIIAYLGLGHLLKHQYVLFTISSIGEIVLIYMGITTLIKAANPKNFSSLINSSHSIKKNYNPNYSIKNGMVIGLVLAFTSPIGLMFWLSTFAASMTNLELSNLTLTNLLINFFIIAGVLLWGAFISLILHFGSKIIDAKKLRIISALSGILLIYFGVKYGINSIKNWY